MDLLGGDILGHVAILLVFGSDLLYRRNFESLCCLSIASKRLCSHFNSESPLWEALCLTATEEKYFFQDPQYIHQVLRYDFLERRSKRTFVSKRKFYYFYLPRLCGGSLVTFGAGMAGQLGYKTSQQRYGEPPLGEAPRVLSFDRPVVQCCAGAHTTAVVLQNGNLYLSGQYCCSNPFAPSYLYEFGEVIFPQPTRVSQAIFPSSWGLILTEAGELYMYNVYLEINCLMQSPHQNAVKYRKNVPYLTRILFNEKVVAISSSWHSCGILTESRKVYMLGDNNGSFGIGFVYLSLAPVTFRL